MKTEGFGNGSFSFCVYGVSQKWYLLKKMRLISGGRECGEGQLSRKRSGPYMIVSGLDRLHCVEKCREEKQRRVYTYAPLYSMEAHAILLMNCLINSLGGVIYDNKYI